MDSLEVKLIGALISFIFIAGIGWYIHHSGYEQGKAEIEEQITQANAKAIMDVAAKNKIIDEKQAKLDESFTLISSKNQEIESAKSDYQALLVQYRAGTQRLRIATNRAGNTTGNNKVATDPGGTAEKDTELMPDISFNILSFARDYSENLRLKNECIDLLNAERQ